MENRTILEIFLTTGFVVSSCGWIYIHWKYVFKPMIEENKKLQKKIIDEKIHLEQFKKQVENIRDMPINIKTPECKYKFKTKEEIDKALKIVSKGGLYVFIDKK